MTPVSLAYTDEGPAHQPEPIVLLHGYPLNRSMWDDAAAHLVRRGARVIRPDLRGQGLSPVVGQPATMDACAQDVIRLADDLGLDQFRLGGFSAGGYIALELVRRHPGRVTGLLLADTRAEPDSDEARAKRNQTIEAIRRTGMAPIADDMMPKFLSAITRQRRPELEARVRRMVLDTLPQGAIDLLGGMRDRPDQRPNLGNIRVPTLIVVGAQDKLTPPEASLTMQRAIPGSQIRIVTNAAHLSPLEAPEPFNHFLDHWKAGAFPRPFEGVGR